MHFWVQQLHYGKYPVNVQIAQFHWCTKLCYDVSGVMRITGICVFQMVRT